MVVGYFSMTKKEFGYYKNHSAWFYSNLAFYIHLHKPMLLHMVYRQKNHELKYVDKITNWFTPANVIDISFDNDAITFATRVKERYFEPDSLKPKFHLIGNTLVNVIPRKIIKSIDIIHYD